MAAAKTTSEVLVDKEGIELSPMPKIKDTLIAVKHPETGAIISIKELMQVDMTRFNTQINAELRGERIELSETPDIESLTKLFSHHVMSKGYYERAEELFREYLSFLSFVNLSNQQAHEIYEQEVQKMTLWLRENKAKTYASLKTVDERNKYVSSFLPSTLGEDLFWWDAYLSQVKTNLQIIKSYRDQFKFACADSVAIQHRIINTLIEVGNLKIDPEVLRAMRMVEASYRPTFTDVKEKAESQSIPEIDVSEGTVTL